MHNLTTLATSTLESITPDLLLLVSGGCGKKHGCCPVSQQTIVNMPPPPQPQILPQAPQPPVDPSQGLPPPAAPGGDIVTTNVSINGRTVSG